MCSLLTLGLAQMEGHQISCNVLIHQYMMPTKQPEQIRWRVTNAKHRQYQDNPIRIFRRNGNLPLPPPLLHPDAGEGTSTPTMMEVQKNNLPGWLIALQQEKRKLISPPLEDEEEGKKEVEQTETPGGSIYFLFLDKTVRISD